MQISVYHYNVLDVYNLFLLLTNKINIKKWPLFLYPLNLINMAIFEP